ncbi:MAG: pyridoxal kinase [Hyphomicrobiaceae bacterium]
MARILSISSEVARGHVGNTAARFALQRLGHEVWALPTVILSNHPGHAKVSGTRLAPEILAGMIEALAANGWLEGLDAVMTGYLPSAAHVAMVAEALERRLPAGLPYYCDPVIGDDPDGLYVEEAAAEAVRELLLPRATAIFPNRFELAWLTGRAAGSAAEAVAAGRALGLPLVVATSIPTGPEHLANLAIGPESMLAAEVARVSPVPHGTGDLLSALMTGHLLSGETTERALGLAVAGVAAAIRASRGLDELALVASQAAWGRPRPATVTREAG